MRSHRLYIFKKKKKRTCNQPGEGSTSTSWDKANQASAHFGVVDVQSALLKEEINTCTLDTTGPLTNTKPPSHRSFKLALKDRLPIASSLSVRSVERRTGLIRYYPRDPARRRHGEGKAPRTTGYFDHRGSFETQARDLKGQHLLIAFHSVESQTLS